MARRTVSSTAGFQLVRLTTSQHLDSKSVLDEQTGVLLGSWNGFPVNSAPSAIVPAERTYLINQLTQTFPESRFTLLWHFRLIRESSKESPARNEPLIGPNSGRMPSLMISPP